MSGNQDVFTGGCRSLPNGRCPEPILSKENGLDFFECKGITNIDRRIDWFWILKYQQHEEKTVVDVHSVAKDFDANK